MAAIHGIVCDASHDELTALSARLAQGRTNDAKGRPCRCVRFGFRSVNALEYRTHVAERALADGGTVGG